MQREYYKRRKSDKFKKLKQKFKRLKRKTLKHHYYKFVTELKATDPGKWYTMAKQIGAVDRLSKDDIHIESLSNLTSQQCVQKIAEHFATISQEYSPVDTTKLPSYLPAPPPPTIEEYEVYDRLNKLRKSKSTLPIDIPEAKT